MSERHTTITSANFMISRQIEEFSEGATESLNIGLVPENYELVTEKEASAAWLGHAALMGESTPDALGTAVNDEQGVELSSHVRQQLIEFADQINDILVKAGNYDTHQGVYSFVHDLKKFLNSDEQIPESVKLGVASEVEKLLYEHPRAVRLSQIKSDLEEVAKNIRSIASN